MNTSGIITTIAVIIILIIGGLALFRGTGEEGISPDPTPPEMFDTQEENTDIFEAEAGTPVLPGDVNGDQEVSSGEEGTEVELGATSSSETTVTLGMSDTGFSHTELEIDPGTTVTFVNNGQAPHWPASDIHPTHEILPEFDSGRGLTTGETYSYTFTESGTWRFHDHLNPRTTGVIVVR